MRKPSASITLLLQHLGVVAGEPAVGPESSGHRVVTRRVLFGVPGAHLLAEVARGHAQSVAVLGWVVRGDGHRAFDHYVLVRRRFLLHGQRGPPVSAQQCCLRNASASMVVMSVSAMTQVLQSRVRGDRCSRPPQSGMILVTKLPGSNRALLSAAESIAACVENTRHKKEQRSCFLAKGQSEC
jgi:hypothetical protein